MLLFLQKISKNKLKIKDVIFSVLSSFIGIQSNKNRERDFKLVSGEPDPETGKISSKVVRKPSMSNMVKDLEAEVQDFQQLVDDNPNDIVLFNLFEELKDLYNKFRTQKKKKYKDE